MRIQSAERQVVLAKQYPAIAKSVASARECHRSLYIRIQRMDEQFLFSKPPVTTEHQFYVSNDGSEAAHLHALSFVVSKRDRTSPYYYEHWSPHDKRVPRDLVARCPAGVEDIAYVATVNDLIWCDYIRDWHSTGGDTPFGTTLRTERTIIIWLPPKEKDGGLALLFERASFEEHAPLNTRDLIDGIIQGDPPYIRVNTEIDQAIKRFEERVYNAGLRSTIDRCSKRGMSGQFSDVQMRTFVLAGRVLLTMQRGKDQISLIAAEDGAPRMGLQSLEGTLPAVKSIMETVTDMFDNWFPSGEIPWSLLKGDPKVKLL